MIQVAEGRRKSFAKKESRMRKRCWGQNVATRHFLLIVVVTQQRVEGIDVECPEAYCGFRNASRKCTARHSENDGSPRVYIYDALPSALYDVDWRPSRSWSCERPIVDVSPWRKNSYETILGTPGIKKRKSCPMIHSKEAWSTLFASQQWRAAEMLLYRATTSLRISRSFDPEQADIFLIPVLPGSKSTQEWNAICSDQKASEEALLNALAPHLKPSNAHRHIFILGKGLANAKKCQWYLEPKSILRFAQRFAYSARVILPRTDFDATRAKPRYGPAVLPYLPPSPAEWATRLYASVPRLDDQALLSPEEEIGLELYTAPNLVSIPYPSSAHLSQETQIDASFARVRQRDVLMSFQGSLPKSGNLHRGENGTLLQDKHYGASVREKITEICQHLPESVCLVDDLDPTRPHTLRPSLLKNGICFDRVPERSFDPLTLELVKGRSTFCLEPLGDSPYRKSIWDSLAMGCIPVVFSLYSEITSPWHWGDWRNMSRIYIPEDQLFEPDFDLVTHLRAIPKDTVLAMQETIANNVHKIIYAIDDLPHDAYETLIRRAHLEAQAYEHAHSNPPALRAASQHEKDTLPATTGQWLRLDTHRRRYRRLRRRRSRK